MYIYIYIYLKFLQSPNLLYIHTYIYIYTLEPLQRPHWKISRNQVSTSSCSTLTQRNANSNNRKLYEPTDKY